MRCPNANCIVHDPMEAQYVRNKFHVVKSADGGCRLRCAYCDSDSERFVVASKKQKWFADDPAALLRSDQNLKELVVFAGEAEAIEAGFHGKRSAAPAKPSRRAGTPPGS
jgi:hypothetical protein